MIRFSQDSWFAPLFVYFGGVIPKLKWPTLVYSLYACCAYMFCMKFNLAIAQDGINLVANSTTFMLVFRLNQCHSRLQHAQSMVMEALGGLRGIVGCACLTADIPATEDKQHEMRQAATLMKMHVCRLAIACAVSLKYHMRAVEMMNSCGQKINTQSLRHALSDLVRIKSLLTEFEAKRVEEQSGLYEVKHDHDVGHTAAHRQLPQGRRAAAAIEKWGYPERVLNVVEAHLSVFMKALRGMDGMGSVGLPLPYLQLCKWLLLIFIVVYPWNVNSEHGWWSNVMVPIILAMTLLGFEVVADDMENPLGDDSADISLYEMIHEFEVDVEAIFNCSEVEDESMRQSWDELGRQFQYTAGCDILAKLTTSGRRARFTDFFEWQPLPRHTVDYIAMQSTDTSSLKGDFSASAAPRRRSPRTGRSDSEPDSSFFEQSKDILGIQHCVALRATLPHIMEARSQGRFLEREPIARTLSFREVMHSPIRK
eukprot:CAMPEP_0170347284 /NCGR_PEP_ID=MMETSP0116_2-20130129/74905_1 /TAXON_ID=400756 /ORGANISM="Durinskia baltica, Strain CSIRO CS-38" /LENGTH=480 /DNA_ID=CAMNT_0010601113 /DNA_START=27 /DNA_END=1471 /DNA_ORIENTATION=-